VKLLTIMMSSSTSFLASMGPRISLPCQSLTKSCYVQTRNPGLSHRVDNVDVHPTHVQPLHIPSISNFLVNSSQQGR
jgi:hypothetical protein